ncbi:MAG: DedA family protein, partial [Desulfobacteraceae bacterium]|nr:DedA family protein [Desulfobacteraceae bacterium]
VITDFISHWAVRCLDAFGYTGAAFLMALESMIAPVPSEAVMPFVGFLVVDGKWDLWVAVAATSAGSVVGSLASYLMGYYGGKPLVLKVGTYLLLDRHDLELTERYFQRRSGTVTLFISRFIPVVRHLISIPAGIGRMPLPKFLCATLVGATLWNTFLLLCGMKLREHWGIVQKYSHQVDFVVVAILLVGMAWFVRGRLKARRAGANDVA